MSITKDEGGSRVPKCDAYYCPLSLGFLIASGAGLNYVWGQPYNNGCNVKGTVNQVEVPVE